MRAISLLLTAALLATSATILIAPTASASCVVSGKYALVCTGPVGPQGQGSLCAVVISDPNINPGGGYGCVAVGHLGTNLVCVKPIPLANWLCV